MESMGSDSSTSDSNTKKTKNPKNEATTKPYPEAQTLDYVFRPSTFQGLGFRV